jgi:hypothetical protein
MVERLLPATIPLDTFTPDGAASLMAIFAQWGLTQLVLAMLGLILSLRWEDDPTGAAEG